MHFFCKEQWYFEMFYRVFTFLLLHERWNVSVVVMNVFLFNFVLFLEFCILFNFLNICSDIFSGADSFSAEQKAFQQSRKLFTQQNKTERNTNIIQWQKGKKKKVQFLLHLVLHEKHLLLFWHRNIRSSVDHLSQMLKIFVPKENKTKETRQKKQDTRQKKQDKRNKDTRQKKQDKIKHKTKFEEKKNKNFQKTDTIMKTKKQKQKAYSTSISRMVPHRSTMLAVSNLTARLRWDVLLTFFFLFFAFFFSFLCFLSLFVFSGFFLSHFFCFYECCSVWFFLVCFVWIFLLFLQLWLELDILSLSWTNLFQFLLASFLTHCSSFDHHNFWKCNKTMVCVSPLFSFSFVFVSFLFGVWKCEILCHFFSIIFHFTFLLSRPF